VKPLIDECLHTSLVELAHAAGHVADHVNYLGLGSSKDWQLMATIRAQDYTFVTNNRSDFLALHGPDKALAAERAVDCEMTIQLGEYKFAMPALGFGGRLSKPRG
jgi:hypothetical protein